jgi:hypothetical protein
MVDALEQRQVVERVAVEPALVVGKALAAPGQPLVHAADLALAEGGRAARLAREGAVGLLDVGGEEVPHAQLGGDRGGDEAVRRRDDGGEVAGVAGDELARARQDDGPDLALHELRVPGVELGARPAGDGGELEVEELVDVERAVLVALVEPFVLRVVVARVQDALLDQELRPLVIAVAIEQRVVEVEEGELALHPCIAALSSGTVTGRRVSSEYWSMASSADMSEPMSRRAWVRR